MTGGIIGAHVSASGGVFNAPANAAAIGATGFALFVKNQKRWTAPPLEQTEAEAFKQACQTHGFAPETILPHDGYLINLGNADPEKRKQSSDALLDEVLRCEMLGLRQINIHPGSHLKEVSEEGCFDLIAKELDRIIENSRSLVIVIENTAGQGTNVGYRFEHLTAIRDRVSRKERIGFCLDTCHTWASGYDIRDHYDEVWDEFDKTVGLSLLKGLHVNDAKRELGSRVDRHDSLGKGLLGMDFFARLASDPRFAAIPLILETPEEEIWAEEISFLRQSRVRQ
jgi:deoxyribonuclease-4